VAEIWWILIGLVVGLLAGGGVVWVYSTRVSKPDSVESLKQENARFREEVNDHFIQTAELINRLTDSYKAVFDHLSDGADKLVEEKAVRERMPQVTDQEVRLKHIGAPRERKSQR
jgi:uncharacterized protein